MKQYLKLVILLSALLVPGFLSAREKQKGWFELRAGWGDQMFESSVCRETKQPIGLANPVTAYTVKSKYRYSQHWFLEGKYNFNQWVSVGLMFDFSNVSWNDSVFSGSGLRIQDNGRRYFTNYSVIPTVAVSYFHHQYVDLYSGFGAGLNVNTGNEKDYKGRTTALAPAVYLNLVGVKAKYSRYYAAFDIGLMASLLGMHEVYYLGTRMFSFSVGVTF